MDKKRIIIIGVIVLVILATISVGAVLFGKSKNKKTPAAESLPAKTETVKTPFIVDMDNDGLTYEQEKTYGTDPAKQDTDGDTFKDGDEVANGYDPLKPAPGDKIVKAETATSAEQSKEEEKRRKVLNDMATMLEAGNAVGASSYTVSSGRDIMERKFSDAMKMSPDGLKILGSTLRQAKLLTEGENSAQYVGIMTAPTGQKIESPFSMRKEAQDWKVTGL